MAPTKARLGYAATDQNLILYFFVFDIFITHLPITHSHVKLNKEIQTLKVKMVQN